MSTKKNAGVVTAYGSAVAGGYQGTYEDFCALMADLGVQVGYLENMTVTVTMLDPDQNPSASYGDGTFTLNIPRGATGATGPEGPQGPAGPTGYPTDAQVQEAVGEWLGENVDPTTGYVLDRTLTQPNAAAPADLVGAQSGKIAGKEYGVYFFDIMGQGSVSILNRIFDVDKNKVSVFADGSSTTYKCVNLFGTPHGIDSTWASADLSGETFYQFDFPTENYDVFIHYYWETKVDTGRNGFAVATKNPNTGTITKAWITVDHVDKSGVKNLFKILPEAKENKNIALFYESRNTSYPNTLTYRISVDEKITKYPFIYSGVPYANEILFTSESVSAGDIIYYDFELSDGSTSANYIELLSTSNQRLGLIGKTSSSSGGLKYFGAFIIPEDFGTALFKTANTVTTTINYLSKLEPERFTRNLSDPLNYMPAYKKVGTGLKTNGTENTTSGTSTMAVTDFISVLPGDLITINEFMGSNTYGLCFYDLKQTYISGLPTKVNVMSLIVPDGAFYVRYTVNKNQTQVINIFRGDELKVKCGNLFGKKAVTFGDSITWYDGQQFTWGKFEGKWCVGYQSYMRRVGMVVTNVGVSGDDITEINEDIRATTYTNYDYATITSGANDTIANLPVGTIAPIGSTFDTTTFYGALQDSIEYILGQKETIKIVLITPIKGTIYPDTPINPLYVKAFKDVGELYGLPVCDWYNTSGINELTYGEYINDPDENNELYWVHPTNAGFKRMADILVPFLKNLEVETIPHAFP